jgi:guanylate kinase
LTVLAGPSGVGKGTVAALVVQRFPQVYLSVSATTRPARAGEAHGANYFFVSRRDFEAMVLGDQMLEWAQYGNHLYGTPREPVEAALGAGRPALLEIDLEGARQVRRTMPGALQVMLVPPSWEELERRLRDRGTEDEAECQRRLERARIELAARDEFDSVVVNDTLERTVDELARIMGLQLPRSTDEK